MSRGAKNCQFCPLWPPPLALFQKCIQFGSGTLPLVSIGQRPRIHFGQYEFPKFDFCETVHLALKNSQHTSFETNEDYCSCRLGTSVPSTPTCVLDNQDFRPREISEAFFICSGWLVGHCPTDWLSRNGLDLDWISSFFIAIARAGTLSIQRSRVDFLMKKIFELKYLTVLSQRLAVHSNAVVSNIRFQSLSIIKHPNPHIVIEGKTFIQHVQHILVNRN